VSQVKRLQRIEASLTPKQAVLLWLHESHQLGLIGYIEKSFNSPIHEAPRTRLTEMVGKAVRESLCKRGTKRDLIEIAVREARKQTDFLIVLTNDLRKEVSLECELDKPYIVLLYEKFERMLERFVDHNKFDRTGWQRWRALLILRISHMWRLKETVLALSERYFDHHPLLFPEDACTLDRHVHELEKLVKYNNSLKGELPAWIFIDRDALTSAIQEQTAAEVAEHVANAWSATLSDFGEAEAAWKSVEPYAVAALNRLRGVTEDTC
jgi:hypothetical protein